MLKKKTHPCHFNELSGIGNSSLKFMGTWPGAGSVQMVLKVVSKLCSTC